MKEHYKYVSCGFVAGCINGLLGAGGGAILVPLLVYYCKLEEREALATCVSIILPLCMVSFALYWYQGNVTLQALPYVLGGGIGGYVGGKLFQKTSPTLLKGCFGILLMGSGLRGFI